LYRDTVGMAGSLGLLVVRIVAGLAFMRHGWPKLTGDTGPFGWMGPESGFPGYLQFLAVLSEVGGGLAWVLGLLTPLASLGLLCTMAVAASTHISKGDPFVGMGGPSYELALVYLSIALLLLLAGPGGFSLDRLIFGRPGQPK
jgi:putative oxidoreductase